MSRREITRRELLRRTAVGGVMAAVPFGLVGGELYAADWARSSNRQSAAKGGDVVNPLKPPTDGGSIPVAFAVSEGAVIIDFCGPWEVFQDVMIPSRGASMDDQMPFNLYTVAEKKDPIRASGGMKIVPDYTFESAPQPKVIVIPAQNGDTEAMMGWIRESTKHTDLTMSVCTGALLLAKTGLLKGKAATTHHSAYIQLALEHPEIRVKPGYRFVEDGNIATAGGLTSGMDLALRVVERYFGRAAAEETVYQMEYQGQGWVDASGASNASYAKARGGKVCPICGMTIDQGMSPKLVYRGKTYYFCMDSHKALFVSAPEKVLKMMAGEQSQS
jgi:putative intracellular protease/amidase/YHS domain-containing protein